MFPRLIEFARAAGIPVLADPVRTPITAELASCITPNRAEAGRALGIRRAPEGPTPLAACWTSACNRSSSPIAMDWADRKGHVRLFPARPRQVCDITGAGDMVLAVLGYMLAAGAEPAAAIEVATWPAAWSRTPGRRAASRRILDEFTNASPAGGKPAIEPPGAAPAASPGRQADA